jgi:hypothetical protein
MNSLKSEFDCTLRIFSTDTNVQITEDYLNIQYDPEDDYDFECPSNTKEIEVFCDYCIDLNGIKFFIKFATDSTQIEYLEKFNEYYSYYVFNSFTDDLEEIEDNRYKMIQLLQKIQQYIINIYKQDTLYLEKCNLIRKYADYFKKKLIKDGFSSLKKMNFCLELIEDTCVTVKSKNKQIISSTTKGALFIGHNYFNITIFGCRYYSFKAIKQTVRHELLHWSLMNYKMNYSDDSAVFHLLCRLYKANAYKEPSTLQMRLYCKSYLYIRHLKSDLKDNPTKKNKEIYRFNFMYIVNIAGMLYDSLEQEETFIKNYIVFITSLLREENSLFDIEQYVNKILAI